MRGPKIKGIKMGDNTICKIEELALKLLYKIYSTDARYEVDKKELKVATGGCKEHQRTKQFEDKKISNQRI